MSNSTTPSKPEQAVLQQVGAKSICFLYSQYNPALDLPRESPLLVIGYRYHLLSNVNAPAARVL